MPEGYALLLTKSTWLPALLLYVGSQRHMSLKAESQPLYEPSSSQRHVALLVALEAYRCVQCFV